METANYTLRLNAEDKKRAEQVFKTLGMTLSTGINVYIKMVGREEKIPFDLAVSERTKLLPATKTSTKEEKKQAYLALKGILAGEDVDLDQARAERLLSK